MGKITKEQLQNFINENYSDSVRAGETGEDYGQPGVADYWGVDDDMSDLEKYKNQERNIEEDSEEDMVDYSEEVENWDELSAREKSDIMAALKSSYERSINESVLELTEEELNNIVKEGVDRLHKKSLAENRLEQINQELNALNNPEAWENSRIEAKEQLKKKHIAWQEITTTGKLMSEGLTEKGIQSVNDWITEFEHRGAAKKLIDALLSKYLMGMTSDDLGDTNIFANGLDTVEEFLIAKEYQNAYESAKETAKEMIRDEGGGMMFEGAIKKDVLSEMSFRDVESMIPVVTPKDKATIEAGAQWEKVQKESVSEIMGRAADLMAEAKKKYEDISK